MPGTLNNRSIVSKGRIKRLTIGCYQHAGVKSLGCLHSSQR